jgi:hypothetical protein
MGLAFVRGMTQSLSFSEPARSLPVPRESDVLVVGGGIAGVSAAVCAARLGAKTLLVERYGYLGGITVGWPVPVVFQYGRPGGYFVQGIAREIVDRLDALGGWVHPEEARSRHPHADGIFDTELLKLVLVEMCEEAGVELLLHSTLGNALTENGRVVGVAVENKSGRQALLGKITVDSTGDGDVAALAGARSLPSENGDAEDPEGGTIGHCSFGVQIKGMSRERMKRLKEEEPERYERLAQKFKIDSVGMISFNMKGDATDAWDLTRMEREGSLNALRALRALREELPGEEFAIDFVAAQFGVRLGRRIAGVKTLTHEAAAKLERRGDEIGLVAFQGGAAGIPYGCLVPERVDGLLMGSRSISVEERMFGPIRLIGTAFALGEAAGTAAGLSVRESVQPRDLEVATLRSQLQTQKALID